MKKNVLKTTLIAICLSWQTTHSLASESTSGLFFSIITVTPSNNDDDDQEVQMPHRAPIHNDGVLGMYESDTGILYLYVSPSIGITMVKVFKNSTLIGTGIVAPYEEANYNLTSYGSGFFQVILTANDGTTYEGHLIINNV